MNTHSAFQGRPFSKHKPPTITRNQTLYKIVIGVPVFDTSITRTNFQSRPFPSQPIIKATPLQAQQPVYKKT
ncbi:hypothetical protein DL98DRAFT_259033 [Cadophora sp. DSE1049]|nr:hypothetical protein DL98DRAFT_259033 [Cadophora sp. DSE1049]